MFLVVVNLFSVVADTLVDSNDVTFRMSTIICPNSFHMTSSLILNIGMITMRL